VTKLEKKYGKVAVLMGGWSAEREVSLMSGGQVVAALENAGVNAEAIDVDVDFIEALKSGGFDRAFNILHGKGGEDGVVQAALQMHGIPSTGSGILASALAMNKQKAKSICSCIGILTPNWLIVNNFQEACKAIDSLSLPVVVKPIFEGSSIGVSIVMDRSQLEDAWNSASQYGGVMNERFIQGVEVTAAIVAGTALPLVSMDTDREFYDYHAKYEDDSTSYTCPSKLNSSQSEEIKLIALKVFSALEAYGWGRVDFIIEEDGHPYFIELNTIPGMTIHSLVPLAANQHGWSFEQLCLKILNSSFGSFYG